MDFDHVRGEKVDDISRMVRSRANYEQLQSEIDKCDVVCANCHRIRTHLRVDRSEKSPYNALSEGGATGRKFVLTRTERPIRFF